jgi:hypothetical protein
MNRVRAAVLVAGVVGVLLGSHAMPASAQVVACVTVTAIGMTVVDQCVPPQGTPTLPGVPSLPGVPPVPGLPPLPDLPPLPLP